MKVVHAQARAHTHTHTHADMTCAPPGSFTGPLGEEDVASCSCASALASMHATVRLGNRANQALRPGNALDCQDFAAAPPKLGGCAFPSPEATRLAGFACESQACGHIAAVQWRGGGPCHRGRASLVRVLNDCGSALLPCPLHPHTVGSALCWTRCIRPHPRGCALLVPPSHHTVAVLPAQVPKSESEHHLRLMTF